MRKDLHEPGFNKGKLRNVTKLVRDAYAAYERGPKGVAQWKRILAELSRLVGRPLSGPHLEGAWSSVDAEEFARQLVGAWIPEDLPKDEMLELFASILADPTDPRLDHWMRCLEANTGDPNISGLIFCPGDYFGHGDDTVELTPNEMLDAALAAGKKAASRKSLKKAKTPKAAANGRERKKTKRGRR